MLFRSSAFAYLTAFAMIGLYWGATRDWNLLYTAAVNALFMLMGLGLVEGFSILSFIAERYNMPKFWRRIVFLFIIFNSLITQLLAFVGIFDMLFDYRKRFLKS